MSLVLWLENDEALDESSLPAAADFRHWAETTLAMAAELPEGQAHAEYVEGDVGPAVGEFAVSHGDSDQVVRVLVGFICVERMVRPDAWKPSRAPVIVTGGTKRLPRASIATPQPSCARFHSKCTRL